MAPKIQTLKPRVALSSSTRVAVSMGESWRTSNMTSTQRGYGYKWQQARAKHLEICPLCVMCRAEGMTTLANVVDHIIPHRGDMKLFWDRSNWQSLCKPHHDGAKQREERQPAPG